LKHTALDRLQVRLNVILLIKRLPNDFYSYKIIDVLIYVSDML